MKKTRKFFQIFRITFPGIKKSLFFIVKVLGICGLLYILLHVIAFIVFVNVGESLDFSQLDPDW